LRFLIRLAALAETDTILNGRLAWRLGSSHEGADAPGSTIRSGNA
jgi:alkanesulfonate monooxygenase SsuD/methylene tetrahydromethanopterin reductase-like flavin-dependent oxidoreductase (luciferase family)